MACKSNGKCGKKKVRPAGRTLKQTVFGIMTLPGLASYLLMGTLTS